MQQRQCKTCEVTKPFEAFIKSSKCLFGITWQCKDCRTKYLLTIKDNLLAKQRQRYAENPEKVLIKNREHRANNLDTIREKDRARKSAEKEENPERIKDSARKHSKKFPHKFAAQAARRRAAKRTQKPALLDIEFDNFCIEEIYHLKALRQEVLGVKLHVDHIIPLVSSQVCGFHIAANLRIVSAKENQLKSNLFWPDMPTQGVVNGS